VQADRAGHTLLAQLAKLEDVSEAEILEPAAIERDTQAASFGS
jgi:acetolactate synthase regulatory subunit